MRTLEEIDRDLTAAREALSSVEGTPAEVYSRIVGYYRSVKNWNRGKREEYGERRLFKVPLSLASFTEHEAAEKMANAVAQTIADTQNAVLTSRTGSFTEIATADSVKLQGSSTEVQGTTVPRILLFVRPACPACPSAKEAAGRLGIPVDLVNADTESGLAEASRRNVLSTPTAILLSANGDELDRALDSRAIAGFKIRLAS
jgi:ribonucleoside-triphosphate reductase